MKTNIALTLNKLIAFARDNLMLDALDEVYTLNRLASLCNVPAVKLEETETEKTLAELLDELKASVPAVDAEAVKDLLLPAPHVVDFYFRDELNRKPQKAFDFLFDLYESCGSVASGEAVGADGYICYAGGGALARPVMLDVGASAVPYTPIASGNRVAALGGDDTLFSSDVAARLVSYALLYGGTIAKRAGDDYYLACADSAVSHAAVKKNVKDGAVKIDLLDYPVPALKISGIAKNSVVRSAAAVIKAATDDNLAFVAAGACDKGTPAVYVIFANAIEKTDVILSSDALSACGVVAAIDFSPLLSVLEKGTALSSDLFAFKPLYSEIGGVKHGAKAKTVLGEAVAKRIKAAIAAAASATEEKAVALLEIQA